VQAGLRRPSQGDAWTKIDLMTQRAAAGGAQQPAQKAGEIFSVSVFRPRPDHASDLAGGGKAAKSECRATIFELSRADPWRHPPQQLALRVQMIGWARIGRFAIGSGGRLPGSASCEAP
jgi:hypothetical protein